MRWNSSGWFSSFAVLAVAGAMLVPVAAEPPPPSPPRTPHELLVQGAREAAALSATGKLAIGCAARTGEWTTTFLRLRKGPSVIAAFADKPLRSIGKDWTRNPAMQDWAYIHDRDGDGQIDHIVFNIGPLPMAPVGDAQLPSIASGEITGDAVMMVLDNMRTAYWQAIDTDADGTLDWLGVPVARKDNGWYSGWALLSRKEGRAECTVVGSEGQVRGACTAAEDGTIEGDDVSARRWVSHPQAVFDAVLQGAATCKLTGKDLRR
jgi:hypothetical protein